MDEQVRKAVEAAYAVKWDNPCQFCLWRSMHSAAEGRAMADGMLAHWLSVAPQADANIEQKVRESGFLIGRGDGKMAKLTAKARKGLPTAEFAGPDRSYPIPDRAHAANAKARAAQMVKKGKLSPSAKAKIVAKANKKLGK